MNMCSKANNHQKQISIPLDWNFVAHPVLLVRWSVHTMPCVMWPISENVEMALV